MTKHHTLYEELYATRKENELLKEANEQLKKQIDTSQVSRLIAENNRLNEICRYWENEHDELAQENEKLKKDYEDLEKVKDGFVKQSWKLKQQNTKLKHKNNQQEKTIDRLIKIITDEHYN